MPTSLPPGFSETVVTTGLTSPTAMEFSPDGRLFVLEQTGNVELVHPDGTTFTALHLNVDSQGERGLLGIAFDPGFGISNRFVYLYYTNPNPGDAPWAGGEHNQLSRFTVDDTDPQHPLFTQEAPILDWDTLSSATNHNGGAIHFGLDGMLYADAGDNVQTFTQAGQTYRVSQTLADLLGKQLRIDVANFNSGLATRDDTTVGHLIPADNPFVGTATGINQLIDALGLRNPFTFAVQPGTGTIFINDVGENTWEEIDRSVAGGNYGWSGGNTDGFGQTPPGPGTYQDPLLAYPHVGGPAGGGDAIVGGAFYNPATPQFPAGYVGKYFYEDLAGGWIRVFDPAHPGSAANPDTSSAFATGTPGGLRDLKVDAAGNLYYLAGNGGEVVRISYSPGTLSTQPAADVTALVVIRSRRTVLGPRPGRARRRVTIVNVSRDAIPGPLSLALDGLRKGVRLLNAAGVTQFTAVPGSPFVIAFPGADDVLAPGEAVKLTLIFRVRPGRRLVYHPRLLAGVGLRCEAPVRFALASRAGRGRMPSFPRAARGHTDRPGVPR